MFKKMLSILLAGTMIFSLVGCNSMEPAETSVTNYLNAVKAQDLETISKYRGEEVTVEGETDGFQQYMLDGLLGSMEFEVISTEEKDETATATVSFTNVNMTIVISEMISQAFGLIFADLSEEEMDTAMQGFFVSAFEKHKENKVTKEVEIEMTKGDGYWIIEATDEMMDAAFGGLYSAADFQE